MNGLECTFKSYINKSILEYKRILEKPLLGDFQTFSANINGIHKLLCGQPALSLHTV